MDRNSVAWSGPMPAAVTPFRDDGSVDEKAFRANIDIMLEKGSTGFVIGGCTGEFWAMTPDERKSLYKLGVSAVAGRGTMMDAVISAAGGRNLRTDASWTVMPLERLIETPPALIALGFFNSGREQVNAWSPSHHPALRRALRDSRTVQLPTAAIACEAWYAIDAAETIAAALRAP